MKAVQHEHTVEVKVPAVVADTIAVVQKHIEENKKPYLFGVGGVVIGFTIARVFASPSINISISTGKDLLS